MTPTLSQQLRPSDRSDKFEALLGEKQMERFKTPEGIAIMTRLQSERGGFDLNFTPDSGGRNMGFSYSSEGTFEGSHATKSVPETHSGFIFHVNKPDISPPQELGDRILRQLSDLNRMPIAPK